MLTSEKNGGLEGCHFHAKPPMDRYPGHMPIEEYDALYTNQINATYGRQVVLPSGMSTPIRRDRGI